MTGKYDSQPASEAVTVISAQNKLVRYETDNQIKTYNYFKDSIVISNTSKSIGLIGNTVVYLDARGKATSSLFRYISGQSGGSEYFFYDGSGELQLMTRKYVQAGTNDSIRYIFEDGNVRYRIQNADTVAYTYYTDKTYQTADYLGYSIFLDYGVDFTKGKNLVKTLTNYSQKFDILFTYEFDAKGNVKKAFSNGGGPYTRSYTYDCD